MDSLQMMKNGLAVFIIAFLCKLIWKKATRPKSNNPFITEPCPPRPLEMDRQVRKKVLKKAFRPELVPDSLDAIIVGSGIGGLSCAGLLARSGKKVLVLEKHDRAGGGTHTYRKKGFEYDIGIHYVGNMEYGSPLRCFIDLLTDSQLDWVEIHDQFDTVVIDEPATPSRSYKYFKGHKAFKKQLLMSFPDEHKGIDRFFVLLDTCKSATNLLLLLKLLPRFLLKFFVALRLHKLFCRGYDYVTQTSVKEVLDDLSDNKDLKTVLAYSFGDYGALPTQACFLMHGMLTNHMLRTGGYYPKGGASEIAYQIIPGIERSGGAVMAGACVEEIIVEDGRACGVKVTSSTPNSPEHVVRAPIIISGAGIYNTYKSLVPKHICESYGVMDNLGCVAPGVSCLQVMVGLNGTKEELGLDAKNYWIFTSNDPGKSTEEFLSMSREDAANTDIPLLFLSFPSTKDPTWNIRYPDKTTCAIVTFSSLSWFDEWKNEKAKKRGSVYDGFKSGFVNQAWSQVLKLFPDLKDKVAHIDGGTPLTHIHYLNSAHGEIYGMHHSKERFQIDQAIDLRPETPIPGLYLTGQDIFTCGFSGAAFGGLLTASKILDRYLISDLINHVKETRKRK